MEIFTQNENETVKYSFTASVALANDSARESYVYVKNAFCSFRGAAVKTDFGCESLYVGNVFFGSFEFFEGRLFLFTTYKPDCHEANKFALHENNISDNKELTPTYMILGDEGQCKNAEKLIAHFMKFKAKMKNSAYRPIDVEKLRKTPYEELLEDGFIVIEKIEPEVPETIEPEEDKEFDIDGVKVAEQSDEPNEADKTTVPDIEFFDDEDKKIQSVSDIEEDKEYSQILKDLKIDSGIFEYKKDYFLRAIDEEWVNEIEAVIPVIFILIKNPRSGLEEREEVVSASLAKKVTTRSVQHLTQHVDMISEIKPNGDVIPSKLLNVFVDETLKTYENRFINTLILRLFVFVNRRYEIVKKEMSDELRTQVTVAESFKLPESAAEGKIYLHMELSQPPEGVVVLKNRTFTTELWKRVEALNGMCTSLMNSPFCKELGKNYVRPPIMRTNAILKNKNLNRCLLLWQYIEGYENAGYEMLIQSDLTTPNPEFVRSTCNILANTYLSFLKHADAKEGSKTLDSVFSNAVISPKLKESFKGDGEDDYDIEWSSEKGFHPKAKPRKYRSRKMTAYEKTVEDAIKVALVADERIRKNLPPPDVEKIKEEEREIS